MKNESMKARLLLIGVLFGITAYGQVPTTGLVAEYLFTGASLNDTGGTANLTLTGSLIAPIPDRAGGANRAVSLNGDHLQRTTGTSTNSFSVSFWIKTSTNDATARVIIDQSERANEGEGSLETGWYAYLKNGTIGLAGNYEWYRWNTSGYLGWQYATTTTNIADGLWHHITITNSAYVVQRIEGWVVGNTYKIYIDNTLRVTKVSEKVLGAVTGAVIRRFITTAIPITIGNSRLKNSSANYRFADAIDDIRYYSRTLSAAEVTALATEAGDPTAATITKADQTITFNALPGKTAADGNFSLTATASSGLAVTYSSSNLAVATVSGSTVTIVGVGSTVITASQSGNMVFNPATNVTNTLTVTQGSQTINFSGPTVRVFGDPAFTLSATATSGLPVSFTSSDANVATISGSTITIVGAGSTTITASQVGNVNYSAATPVQRVFTVNKAAQVITFTTLATKTVVDGNFNLAATSTSGLPVSYTIDNTNVATISGSTVTIVGAGITYIYALQAGNANYNAATIVEQRLTVTKANQTITFGTLPIMSFGDPSFTLMGTSSSALPVSYTSSNTSVATVSGSTLTIVGVGTSTITASQAGNVNFNTATSVAQNLTVVKANQSITFGTLVAKTFGEAAFELSATTSSGLTISYTSSNMNVATVSGNTATIVGVGSTTITAVQAGNGNFNPATAVQQSLTVGKANQTITFNALPIKVVTDIPFALSSTTSSGLPVTYTSSNPAVATISGTTVTIVAVGTTDITASQGGDDNYEAASDVVQVLTVNAKQDQAITFAPLADVTLGNTPFALTATASSNLPVSYTAATDKIQISGAQVTLLKAGRVTVTANQSGNELFNAAIPVSQSFCIKPAKPVMTLSNANTASLTLTSSSTIANQWFQNGVAVAGATNQVFTVIEPGTYKVQVQADDCLSSFSDDQVIIITAIEPNAVNGVNVYPNPASEQLTIDLAGFIKNSTVFISTVDLLGRTASQFTGEGGAQVSIDVRSFVPGQYIIQLRQGNTRITKSFIKSSN
jgi:hypothetical protein